jgi:16S rRNA (uracil1498-N3)-methyltransferase
MSDAFRIIATGPFVAGQTVVLDDAAAHHARVRRIAVGDRVALFDGAGQVADGVLAVAGAVTVETVRRAEALPAVHLLAPVADRERMLWLAEKSTELGLTSWRAVRWRRSRSVTPRGEGPAFHDKLAARMRSAAEQSGNPWLPAILPDQDPSDAIATGASTAGALATGTRYLLTAGAPGMFGTMPRPPVTVALGPEGGIEPDEAEMFLRAGFVAASIGPFTMRFETAGAAALALVRASLEVR